MTRTEPETSASTKKIDITHKDETTVKKTLLLSDYQSNGCQVVYGAKYYYDFLYKWLRFIPTTKQERWYYTIVESGSIKGFKD